MEFNEKLQQLRKSKGLTQEELAEKLYVSRTAVSKWESGRGYPSIDSLKEIAKYFSVTIDDLLSGEKLISIAEKESKSKIRRLCSLLFGITDICSFLMIALPLYPKAANGYVYSVSLLAYTQKSLLNRSLYWVMFLALVFLGVLKVCLAHFKTEKGNKLVNGCSMLISILGVAILALSGETYAVTMVFLLLLIKGGLLFSMPQI